MVEKQKGKEKEPSKEHCSPSIKYQTVTRYIWHSANIMYYLFLANHWAIYTAILWIVVFRANKTSKIIRIFLWNYWGKGEGEGGWFNEENEKKKKKKVDVLFTGVSLVRNQTHAGVYLELYFWIIYNINNWKRKKNYDCLKWMQGPKLSWV